MSSKYNFSISTCFRLFLAFFFFTNLFTLSAMQSLDSYEKKDSLIVDSLNAKSFEVRNIDPVQAILNAKKALMISEAIKYDRGIMMSNSFLGVGYRNIVDYHSAIFHYQNSYKLADSIGHLEQKAYALNNLGNLYFLQGNDSLAVIKLFEALEIANEINDERIKSYCELNLGRLYRRQGKWALAEKNLKSAIDRRKEIDNQLNVANAYIDLALMYEMMNNLSQSLKYYNIALELSNTDVNGQNIEAEVYYGMGLVYQKQNRIRKSIEFLDKSILVNTLTDDKLDLLKSYKSQYENFKSLNNYSSAIKYFEKYDELKDQIVNISTLNNYARLQVQFETAKIETDNQALKQQNALNEVVLSRQRIIIIFVAIGFITVIILAIMFWYRYRLNKRTNELLLAQKEEILKQREELRESNKSKSQLLSIIAHDLRNPFQNILSISDLLTKHGEGLTEKEKTELIESLGNSASIGSDLLNNLLIWAKSQSGIVKYTPEEVDIQQLIKETLPFFKSQTERKKIKLVQVESEKVSVKADLEMIKTILRNLISNAIKFTEESGLVEVGVETGNKFVEIFVRDNGIGMDPEFVKNVFQLDSESHDGTVGEKGSGLGLTICWEFAAKHKGSIEVESKLGEGSTFYFMLPIS